MKIAVAGKGGVGKTLIASGIAWTLARAGRMTIAIDADPSPNLALALGIPQRDVETIVPVSEQDSWIKKKTGTKFPGVFNLNFSVADLVKDLSVPTPAGVHLLVMGTVKSMGSGCTCPANSLVRNLLRHLIVDRAEAVVLDMEAGIEHLGRGTAECVDIMIVVSDANRQSLEVGKTIARIALGAGIPRVQLVGNRIRDEAEKNLIISFAEEHGIPLLGLILYDPTVSSAGVAGEPILSLEGTPALQSIEEITRTIAQLVDSKKTDRVGV